MKEHRTIRYRLHPGDLKKNQQLQGTAGACRFVWNHFVGKLRDDYTNTGSCDFRFPALSKEFTLLRKDKEKWLKTYASYIVRDSLKPIETSYKEFFKDIKTGGKLNRKIPRFHSKYIQKPSFPINYQSAKVTGSSIFIQKVGWMKLTGVNPYPDGEFKSGRVIYECGKWYVYLVYEVEADEVSLPDNPKVVGIDLNVGQLASSDNKFYYQPEVLLHEARRRRYQRKMSRQDCGNRKKGRSPSNRYLKTRLKYQKECKKILQIRTNWCHQVSREIANEYDMVYLEDLNIRDMTKSAKGTLENPGKNVKAKSGLNREILKSGWGKLESCLSYKTTVSKVPAQYTSQMCSVCGHTERGSRKSQSHFKCLSCGHEDNADVNAALNILAFGNGATGHGDCRVTWSVKCQEIAYGSVSNHVQ